MIPIAIIPTRPCSPKSRASAVMLSRIPIPINGTDDPKISSRTTAAEINRRPNSEICLSQFLTVSNILTPRMYSSSRHLSLS